MHNQLIDTLPLKIYSVAKAIESGNIDNMEKIFRFLTPDITLQKDKQNPNIIRIVHKKLPSLTKAQRTVLWHAVELSDKGTRNLYNQTIADRMKQSNANISYHMRKLVRHGYVQRSGNKLYVCYLANGDVYQPTIKRYPVGAAKGYKLQDVVDTSTKDRLTNVA